MSRPAKRSVGSCPFPVQLLRTLAWPVWDFSSLLYACHHRLVKGYPGFAEVGRFLMATYEIGDTLIHVLTDHGNTITEIVLGE